MQQDPILAFLISQGFSNTILERFWPKVSKHGPIPERCPELGPCWLWIAGTDIFGYGIIAIGGHRKGHERCGVAAHRVSWMIRFGVIPEKVCVLHKCDNPP